MRKYAETEIKMREGGKKNILLAMGNSSLAIAFAIG